MLLGKNNNNFVNITVLRLCLYEPSQRTQISTAQDLHIDAEDYSLGKFGSSIFFSFDEFDEKSRYSLAFYDASLKQCIRIVSSENGIKIIFHNATIAECNFKYFHKIMRNLKNKIPLRTQNSNNWIRDANGFILCSSAYK